MATIQLQSQSLNTTTTIPNRFFDEFMPDANGEFVKIYLFLFRNINNPNFRCSISTIADSLNHTEKDIKRALKYWERMNLLALSYDENKKLSGITLLDMNSMDAVASVKEDSMTSTSVYEGVTKSTEGSPILKETASSEISPMLQSTVSAETTPILQATVSSAASIATDLMVGKESTSLPQMASADSSATRKNYTLDEVKDFRKDPNVSELFFIIETYMKRTLSSNDINTILFWYDGLHFSSELIIYLVEYCISKGHSSIRYMDKVALGWKESQITTIDQAKAEAAIHSQAYYGVMKAMGITGRNLVDSENQFVQKWTNSYGFELSIIQEACNRTISAIHQPSFEYADTILTNWHKNQVHNMDDIKKLDADYSRSKKTAATVTVNASSSKNNTINFSQRDYDFDQLEAMLLTTSVQ